VLNGRRTVKRVDAVIDYDYDSDCEWGEEESGEELNSDNDDSDVNEEQEQDEEEVTTFLNINTRMIGLCLMATFLTTKEMPRLWL